MTLAELYRQEGIWRKQEAFQAITIARELLKQGISVLTK
jgi:hypothetical protein